MTNSLFKFVCFSQFMCLNMNPDFSENIHVLVDYSNFLLLKVGSTGCSNQKHE